MEIRLPSQSFFLAGESPEVDKLVKRARPVDGADPRSRAAVAQTAPTITPPARSIVATETNVDYESIAASFQARMRTPADLYRQVYAADFARSTALFVDVYA